MFVDSDGTYVGDFSYGDGPGGPFGWISCMSFTDLFGCFRYFDLTYRCRGQVRIHVPFEFGAGAAYTVEDTSGPPGLEAMPAMRIDHPGCGGCHVGWAGPQVVDEATGEWATGLLDGSTGWDPPSDELWAFSCWAKVVPDLNGITVDDMDLRFDVAPEGFGAGSPAPDHITLTDDWQFFYVTFFGGFVPSAAWFWPLIHLARPQNQTDDTCHFFSDLHINTWHHKGSVLIKCAHLYPVTAVASGGNWIDSFHGRG